MYVRRVFNFEKLCFLFQLDSPKLCKIYYLSIGSTFANAAGQVRPVRICTSRTMEILEKAKHITTQVPTTSSTTESTHINTATYDLLDLIRM